MSRKLVSLAFVTAVALAVGVPEAASADWSGDGVAAGHVSHYFMMPGPLIRDPFGGVIDVWASSPYAEVDEYVQRVTLAGDVSPGWPAQSIRFTGRGLDGCCDYLGFDFALFDAAADDSGGVYVVFHDPDSVILDHYLINGQHDVRWPASGLRVSGTISRDVRPRVASDGSGGAIVAWVSEDSARLLVLRVRPDAQPAPGWPAGGVPVLDRVAASPSEATPELVEDGAGGVFLLWLDDRARAFHITAAGTLAPDWPAGGLALGSFGPSLVPATLKLLPSGDHHLIAMWFEDGGDSSLVMQRAGRDGTLDPAWPAEGYRAVAASLSPQSVVAVADGQGGMTLLWTQSAATPELRALRVLSNGTRAPGWPAGGLEPLDAGAVFWAGFFSAATGPTGGVIVAWDDHRPSGSRIRARWLLGNGQPDPGQPDAGRIVNPVWSGAYVKAMVDDGAGGAFVAWQRYSPFEGENSYLSYLPYDATVDVPAVPAPASVRLELVSLAPNPATHDLTVRIRLAGDSPARIELLDLAGRRRRTRDVHGGGEQSVRIEDLGGIEPGLYVVRLAQGGRARTARVVFVR